jgi:uncharacterized RDD family membrane protein YckC
VISWPVLIANNKYFFSLMLIIHAANLYLLHMQTIKITTAQNIDIDYELAGIGDRFLARLVDYAIFIGLYMVCMIFAVTVGNKMWSHTDQTNVSLILVSLVIWLLMCVLYDVLCEVFFNGQTIGKRAAKIKVVSINGNRPKVGQYLLRWVFRLLDFSITGGCAAIVTVVLSKNRQRIGDIVAGTTVVKVNAANKFDDLVFAPLVAGHEVQYAAVSQLTDDDIVLIHDVIKNFNRTRNSAMVYKLAVRIKNHLNLSSPANMNEYQFLEAVLHDYKYVTAGADIGK